MCVKRGALNNSAADFLRHHPRSKRRAGWELTKINEVTDSHCPKIRQHANNHTCDYRVSCIFSGSRKSSVSGEAKKLNPGNLFQRKKMRDGSPQNIFCMKSAFIKSQSDYCAGFDTITGSFRVTVCLLAAAVSLRPPKCQSRRQMTRTISWGMSVCSVG